MPSARSSISLFDINNEQDWFAKGEDPRVKREICNVRKEPERIKDIICYIIKIEEERKSKTVDSNHYNDSD